VIAKEPFYKKIGLAIDDDESVRGMKVAVGDESIDLLINNAGVLTRGLDKLSSLTREQMLQEFNLDAVSPMMVAQALEPNLVACKGSIINVSSLMGSIGDAGSAGLYAYRAAKSALNMLTKVLSLEMNGKMGYVVALHPGMVGTDMLGGMRPGAITAEEAAGCMIDTYEKLTPEMNGCLISRKGKIEPW